MPDRQTDRPAKSIPVGSGELTIEEDEISRPAVRISAYFADRPDGMTALDVEWADPTQDVLPALAWFLVPSARASDVSMDTYGTAGRQDA